MLKPPCVRIVQTPVQAPNANACAERFVDSIREECLGRVILFGERRLRHVIDEFVAHYHRKRNHQELGNDHRAGTHGSRQNARRFHERAGLIKRKR